MATFIGPLLWAANELPNSRRRAACGLVRTALAQILSAPTCREVRLPRADLVPVAIDTSAGRIVIALDRLHAPLTTANFLAYVDAHQFDGETFYRAMPYGTGGLIQGGISSDVRKLYSRSRSNRPTRPGYRTPPGTIAMAAPAPGTGAGRLFHHDHRHHRDSTAPNGFAAFGHVVEGMDVVKAILAAPVSATKGDGAMKGQMLDPPVKIFKAARLK